MARRGFTLLVLLAGLLALVPSAGAAGRNEILRDCEDDSQLAGNYSAGELRDARNNINSGLDAYSDCRDVLSAALLAQARRRGQGAGAAPGGGSAPGTELASPQDGAASPGSLSTAPGNAPPEVSAEEARELRAARTQLPEVDVRGQRVVAGVDGAAGASAEAGLPTSLAVVLGLLAAAALLAAITLLRRRVHARPAA